MLEHQDRYVEDITEELTGRREYEASIIARAWNDPMFRDRLVSDPRGVFLEEFGIEVPPDVELNVLVEKPGSIYLVIPNDPSSLDQDELTEEQKQESAARGALCHITNVQWIGTC
ncbi:hypothetical protein J2857_002865 [Neorhizobium galegae]|uniref:NHLP leader peptide family RiPP precursor n=1 Tax=Neorhizobium galegae TaxID=399 RepID=UPI001AE19743|nr:NHLP leader peptide family RiPP precursor [Neorhizobium galegae]MBP2560096.1 hypothetical protein [Neorhizobium galegae]